MGETADFSVRRKARGRTVTPTVRERRPFARSGPLPRRRWIAAGVSAIILHLALLAAFLVVPHHSPEDTEAPQTVVVTLMTEPPAATHAAPASLLPAGETAPDPEPAQSDAPKEPPTTPPEAAVPSSEISPPPLETPVPPPPPPEAAVPAPDIPPPPPESAVPAPANPPPPPKAPVVPAPPVPPPSPRPTVPKTASPRLRPIAPAPEAAPPSTAAQAEPRPPGATALSENVFGSYRKILAAHVQSYQRYPSLARTRHEEGRVDLHVTIRRDGQIVAMSIEHGSGSETLDREALATLRRADPLPPIPPGVPGATIELIFPLGFRLE